MCGKHTVRGFKSTLVKINPSSMMSTVKRLDLFEGCRMQWGPSDVLIPSPGAISIFSTPLSIFSTRVLFSVAKFLFLELDHTGPVSCFV